MFNYLNILMWCCTQEKKCGPELTKWEVIHCSSFHGNTPSSSSVQFQRILLELEKFWRRKLRMTKHGNTWFIVTYYVMTLFEYFICQQRWLAAALHPSNIVHCILEWAATTFLRGHVYKWGSWNYLCQKFSSNKEKGLRDFYNLANLGRTV